MPDATAVFDVGSIRLNDLVSRPNQNLDTGAQPIGAPSVLNAEFMANEVPGVRVPDSVLERMGSASGTDAARAEGVAIAQEMGAAASSLVPGAHVAATSGRIESAVEVLTGLR